MRGLFLLVYAKEMKGGSRLYINDARTSYAFIAGLAKGNAPSAMSVNCGNSDRISAFASVSNRLTVSVAGWKLSVGRPFEVMTSCWSNSR